MANFLDSVHEYLTAALIADAAQQVGEKENSVAKALGAWCAVILAGLAGESDDRETLERLHRHLIQFPGDIAGKVADLLIPGNLAHQDPKDQAGHLLGQVFGPRIPALSNGVAAFSGAQPESTSFLLGVSGPLVLSLLAHRVQTASLTPSGLANLLRGDQDRVLSALPSGLGALLGVHPDIPVDNEPAAATGTQWLWSLLLLLAAGAGILLYMKWGR